VQRVLVFAADPFPPFTYSANGAAAGPIADTIKAVCVQIKRHCRLDVLPWRRALAMAEEGLVDGLFAIASIPERERYFHLSPPIIESAYAVFVQDGNDLRYAQPHDLDGYTVAAYGPSAASLVLDGIAKEASGLGMQIETDNLTALRMLGAGRYGRRGAVLANVDVGRQIIREHGIAGLHVAGMTGRTLYTVGLSRKGVTADEASAFNAALVHLMQSGEVRRIVEGYGLRPAPTPSSTPAPAH